MGGWTGIAVASLMQLVWRHPLAAVAARAIALPGALFTVICLVTGSIWGRPTWGTYWEWDGRMTSMLVLLFLYIGYIALADAERGARTGRGALDRDLRPRRRGQPADHPLFGRVVEHASPGPEHRRHGGSSIDASMLWPLVADRARLLPAVRRDRADADAGGSGPQPRSRRGCGGWPRLEPLAVHHCCLCRHRARHGRR